MQPVFQQDGAAYLAPGEFLTPGVDPAPIKSSITKDTKTIEMDGLGFAMAIQWHCINPWHCFYRSN